MAPTLALLLPLLLVAYFALPHLLQRMLERRLLRVCRRHRWIAITFDDGPGRQLTPLVLERLAAAGAPATFFLLGRAIDGHRDLVATMRAHGHEIGSHGEAHVDHLRTMPWCGIRDTAKALARLCPLLQQSAREIAFRPPHGRMNLLSLVHARLRGSPIAGWTHDGYDTRLRVDVPPAITADSLRATGGGVMLLHDFDRTIPNPTARVLARLDAILELRHEGFRFVRFAELLHVARGGVLLPLPTPPLAPHVTAPPAHAPAAAVPRQEQLDRVRRPA